jgi:hypothetical protein
MPRQADLKALFNLIEQAYLAVGSDPIPAGGIDSCRENLKAAVALAKILAEEKRSPVA